MNRFLVLGDTAPPVPREYREGSAVEALGTGPILSVHDAEAALGETLSAKGGPRALTFLRAAYFMENWAASLQGVAQGVLPTFLRADRAIPMVATRDIGVTAADLLGEGAAAAGKRTIHLAGPREVSPLDVAAALGRAVGKPIAAQPLPDDTMAAALLGAGMSPEWARLFQELTHGINVGRVAWEDGPPVRRGETDVDSVLASLLRGS